MTPIFDAALQYTSQEERDAVVKPAGHDGALIGSGIGTVAGARLRGRIRWSLWSGSCVYPAVRAGEKVPPGLHLCTMSPSGFIETDDGATIRFDGRGYGLRSRDAYRVSLALAFGTDDPRYAWLLPLLGSVDGTFDEKAGRADWKVYVSE